MEKLLEIKEQVIRFCEEYELYLNIVLSIILYKHMKKYKERIFETEE